MTKLNPGGLFRRKPGCDLSSRAISPAGTRWLWPRSQREDGHLPPSRQVRRNVQLFCSSSGHRELSRLVLTGGGSLLPGLAAQVGSELNCEVLHPDPFALFGKPKGEGAAHGAKFMTALGLALRSFTPCQI